MAQRDEQRKIELLVQLSLSRAQIRKKRSALVAQIDSKKEEIKEKINVPKRIKSNIQSSFSSSPVKWFVGSAVGGLLVTKLFFGKTEKNYSVRGLGGVKNARLETVPEKVSKGLFATTLLFVAKPFIKSFVLKQGRTYLLRKFMPQQHQIETAEDHYDDQPQYRQI